MSAKWLSTPVMILVSLPVQAHKGDRIIPIFEITDEQLELVDIEEGSIDEWEDFAEPSLTTFDFSRFSTLVETIWPTISPTSFSESGWAGTAHTTGFTEASRLRMIRTGVSMMQSE